MKNILVLLLLLSLAAELHSQQSPGKNHSKLHINCVSCHTCGIPTKDDPCWVACPRENMITVYLKAEQTDELITIDQGSERYGPVYFSHKIHAQMSVMLGGCGNCHHHNTLDRILKCSSCHEASRQRENISIPDLKGAYHRQCMECHREWSHETGCTRCHAPIKDVKKSHLEESKKQYAGKLHPPITEPNEIVYETSYEKGKYVTYFHEDHVKNFKIKCISCHAQESCTKCHDVKNETHEKLMLVKEKKSLDEHHRKCISCHKQDACSSCHLDKPQESFNHEKRTGWELNKHHLKISCSDCHGEERPFKSLDSRCESCHDNFKKGSFRHSRTGLKLTEPHTDLNCEDCHTGNNFAAKPGCGGCHEDFIYPKKKPGELVSR